MQVKPAWVAHQLCLSMYASVCGGNYNWKLELKNKILKCTNTFYYTILIHLKLSNENNHNNNKETRWNARHCNNQRVGRYSMCVRSMLVRARVYVCVCGDLSRHQFRTYNSILSISVQIIVRCRCCTIRHTPVEAQLTEFRIWFCFAFISEFSNILWIIFIARLASRLPVTSKNTASEISDKDKKKS